MCKLQVQPNQSYGNKLYFFIRNDTENTIWFRYSYKVYNKQGQEICTSLCEDSYKPNRKQKLTAKTSMQIAVNVESGITDGLVFVCEISELDGQYGDKMPKKAFMFRLKMEWIKEE